MIKRTTLIFLRTAKIVGYSLITKGITKNNSDLFENIIPMSMKHSAVLTIKK
jgi:hypothetical protein